MDRATRSPQMKSNSNGKPGETVEPWLAFAIIFGFACVLTLDSAQGEMPPTLKVRINNGLVSAPAGIAFIVEDQTAFVLDVELAPGKTNQFAGRTWTASGARPGVAAPDDSIHEVKFESGQTNILWQWGRVGNAAVGCLHSDKPTTVVLRLVRDTWPDFTNVMAVTSDGATGDSVLKDGQKISWRLVTDTAPTAGTADTLLMPVTPERPVRVVAGIGKLPEIGQVNRILNHAKRAYEERRPAATGDWGDFVGAIADNLNNTRVYSSDNLLVYTVSRRWAHDVNSAPYFCWDSFFNAALGCLDDPQTARATVRAVLSAQLPSGKIPNFSHVGTSEDRSQPPVGALCVWKINQRWPDKAFLAEVYPKLKKWHAWWLTAREARHDGLLEWGSDGKLRTGNTSPMQAALYETGWDNTPEFQGATMVGDTMDAYAVDLNSLWAMDAEYLALIAGALGKPDDAADFRLQQKEMNRRINDVLWNEKLGMYCSRLWDSDRKPGPFLTRLTPMNFYPLICGAPDANRAARILKVLTDPTLFWGRWKIPTVPYNDPVWPRQDYWRGPVWGPANYLVFQGLKRYASSGQLNQFAQSSVDLFMRNWTARGVCGELYRSTDGNQGSDPHYTWGSLLCLIGIENIVDMNNSGTIVTGKELPNNLKLQNIPLGGKLYSIETRDGHVRVRQD